MASIDRGLRSEQVRIEHALFRFFHLGSTPHIWRCPSVWSGIVSALINPAINFHRFSTLASRVHRQTAPPPEQEKHYEAHFGRNTREWEQ